MECKITTKPLSEIFEAMSKENWTFCYFEKESGIGFWQRKKKSTRTKKVEIILEDTMYYDKTRLRTICKFLDCPEFQKAYKEFRVSRFEKYKDEVTERAEYMMIKKLGQKHRLVAISMLERAVEMGWKTTYESLQEEEKIIAESNAIQEKEQEKQQTTINKKEGKKVLESKIARQQKMKESGIPEFLWIARADVHLIFKHPRMRIEHRKYLYPEMITRLLGQMKKS